MKLKKLEKEIEKEILTHLASIAWIKAWKVETQGQYDPKRRVFRKKSKLRQTKGIPDICAYIKFKPPIPLFIEVKSETGRLTPDQDAFLTEARLSGCVAFVARSVEDVIRNLNDAVLKLTDAKVLVK